MAKKESTFINMVLALFLVTGLASTALGFVYKVTKGPIEEAKAKKKTMAISRVLPEFDNMPSEEVFAVEADGDSVYFYVARMGNDTVGYAIETFSKRAFGGSLKLLAGLLPDGTINNVAVLEHKETPGLGDKISKSKSKWSEQFNGKHPDTFPLKVVKDGGPVDAITASTITSRAYCDALQRAYDAFKKGGQE